MKILIGIAIIAILFILLGASWYLFPKQFYLLDDSIRSLRTIDMQDPDPGIDTLEELDAFIANHLTENNVPGAAVALIVDNDIVWQQGYGYADLEAEIPVTVDTAFQIGSVSKAYMGVAIMHAVEAGYLSLDDEINSILPFDVVHPAYPDTAITVRHLVTHTSAITDSFAYTQSYGTGDPKAPLGEFLEDYLVPDGQHYNAGNNFTDATPGTSYEYSNVAASLAGYVVEVATGTPFNVYMRQFIFEPLNMRDSGYFRGEFSDTVIASAYLRQNTPFGYVSYPTYPDGMIRASVNDISTLLATIMNAGTYNGVTILSAEATNTLLSPALEVTPDTGVFWEVFSGRKRNRFGHNGSDPGAIAFMYFNADTRLGAVLLINSDTFRTQTAAANIMNQIFNGEGIQRILSESNS